MIKEVMRNMDLVFLSKDLLSNRCTVVMLIIFLIWHSAATLWCIRFVTWQFRIRCLTVSLFFLHMTHLFTILEPFCYQVINC